jgi:hypothetical protein
MEIRSLYTVMVWCLGTGITVVTGPKKVKVKLSLCFD